MISLYIDDRTKHKLSDFKILPDNYKCLEVSKIVKSGRLQIMRNHRTNKNAAYNLSKTQKSAHIELARTNWNPVILGAGG